MGTIAYLIDGMLSGTGIRDAINGGYVAPGDLALSPSLQAKIRAWQRAYEEAHFKGFPVAVVAELDRSGQALALSVQEEKPELRVGYYSNGLMQRLDC